MIGRAGISVVAMAVLTTACTKPAPVTRPPEPTLRDLVVLVPDPESGAVGEVSVSTPLGSVTLTRAGEGSDVRSGQAPTPPALRPPDEIQRLFGDTLGAMPMAPQHFVLYFESGFTTLTAESKVLLEGIPAVVIARTAAEVTVVGHTDTVGAAPVNVKVALSRATLIRDLLVAQGVGTDVISVASHGESNPVVPTPDETAEARNRRVEVTVR